MQGDEERIEDAKNEGAVYSFPCPECGHKFEVVANLRFKILPGKRRHRRPEVCDFLSNKEWQRFRQLKTGEKIIFGIGKFKDVRGRTPSIGELEDFIDLSRQIISEYAHYHPRLMERVMVEEQKRDEKKRFVPVHLELTEMGRQTYQHIIDSLLGE